MPFQKTLNRDLPRAVAGDFASTNPRQVMLAREGGLRTAEVITVGKFAFADLATGLVYASNATGRVIGFVYRNNQGVVPLGQEATMLVRAGREIALLVEGDVYTTVDGDVTVGAAIYADPADGTPTATQTDMLPTRFKAAEPAEDGELVKITVNGI